MSLFYHLVRFQCVALNENVSTQKPFCFKTVKHFETKVHLHSILRCIPGRETWVEIRSKVERGRLLEGFSPKGSSDKFSLKQRTTLKILLFVQMLIRYDKQKAILYFYGGNYDIGKICINNQKGKWSQESIFINLNWIYYLNLISKLQQKVIYWTRF